MKYEKLIEHASEYWPAIKMEEKFPTTKRSLLKNFSSIVFLLSLFGLIISSLGGKTEMVSSNLPTLFYQINNHRVIFQILASWSVVLWLVVFSVDGYYRSYWFSGMSTKLKEGSQKLCSIQYEVAEILLEDRENPSKAFLKSNVGREILVRSGLEFGKIKSIPTGINTKSFDWPSDKEYTIERLLRIISEHDQPMMAYLFRNGVQKKDLIGATRWVQKIISEHKHKKRYWSRDRLGRITGIAKDWSYGYVYYLEQFAIPIEETSDYLNLNPENKQHKKESQEIEAVLARGRESNALLVGKDGTGKMATIALVAREINQGNIFPQLEHKHIYVLDGQALVSSGSGKNSFEQTLRLTLNEARQAGNIILVIPDIASVIQSARASGSDMVALLDPYLRSDSLQIIGTTNEQEYFQLLEKIPKIIQRFEKVTIEESDESSTLSLVLEYASNIENRNHFFFTFPAISRLVTNTERYINTGVMPDKAIDILLEFSAIAKEQKVKIIEKRMVDKFFSKKTNIPIGETTQKEREDLLHLEEKLRERVVGQSEAVKIVATTMRRARAGVQNPNRPIGSFLFLGPTGVGKTEVSKSLAEVFFGDEDSMMRFDMSEYKTSDSLDKLIGSFYKGTPGSLVKSLKKTPYGLVLLDEFEKSNEQVKDLFLQILDEGKFSDMGGNQINARNTIIIATSNAGSDIIWDLFREGKNPALFKQNLINSIIESGIYKPELLNRFDGIVIFHPLKPKDLNSIAELMLKKLKKRILKNKGIDVIFTEETIHKVATEGANPQFGARPMNRYIQENIEQNIADQILTNNTQPGGRLNI